MDILQIKDLSIGFLQDEVWEQATNNISFTVCRGEITALVGESGSGKSVTALSILQLLPATAKISGKIIYTQSGHAPLNLLKLSERDINHIRGNRISMIFQEPMTSLNPVYTCGYQVTEVLRQHKKLTRSQAQAEALKLFEQVELPEPASILKRYPHQISGGQKQRVMIAMAISCAPDILIADEPTTALDVRVQANILKLLKKIQLQSGMGILLITHDLALVADVADKVVVMYKGEIAEAGIAKEVLKNPAHTYTKSLLTDIIKGKKIDQQEEKLSRKPAQIIEAPLLSVQHISVYFPSTSNIFNKRVLFHKAVDDVSFEVMRNEIIGLVGESGCGKTTLGRTILQLIKPTSGKIFLENRDITHLNASELKEVRKDLQIVFQDPYGSLNPRITIGSSILEPLRVHNLYNNHNERKERVINLLEQVKLEPSHINRYPHQFSGGQRQRICIARALALNPNFIVFDESVSALDVRVQAQVLKLINELKAGYNFTAIFISHDLSVVHYISDRILVMKKGKIVESGSSNQVYNNPQHPYTRQLIEAMPGKGMIAL
ncbi:MAG: ABC transporter ATP-binding protein [Ferruginibacter sp.]